MGTTISGNLGVCLDYLRRGLEEALAVARRAHEAFRSKLGLPSLPPRTPGGLRRGLCVDECVLGPGERSYCGVWRNEGRRLGPASGRGSAIFYAYYDPLPTNCVASPVCPTAGRRGSLAVFFGGCNLDCLFCQNSKHKLMAAGRIELGGVHGVEGLARLASNPTPSAYATSAEIPRPG